jgi:hypothetical protein
MDANSIFIVVIIMILLYYIVSTFLTSSGLTDMTGAEEQITVAASKMRNSGGANSSYSIWFYVDDWSTGYGEEKIVFKRLDMNNHGIVVKLGEHTNDIIVSASHASNGSAGSSNANTNIDGYSKCASNDGSGTYKNPHTCPNDNTITFYTSDDHTPEPNGNCNLCEPVSSKCVKNPEMDTTCGDDNINSGFTNMTSTKATEGFNIFNLFRPSTAKEGFVGDITDHTCTVRNVPIQKWVNLIVSFNGTTLDVYMNGKLVKTCIMDNVSEISGDSDVIISPTGKTFSGQTSKFKFWNTPMDPQKAWYTYSDGYAPGLGLASFFKKYKFRMSLLENNIETTSVTI